MPRRAFALVVLAATALALASPARADTSEDKKRQVAAIADRIEQLGDQAAQLGYAPVAMGGTLDVTDDLGALIEDAKRECRALAERKAARERALKNLSASKD